RAAAVHDRGGHGKTGAMAGGRRAGVAPSDDVPVIDRAGVHGKLPAPGTARALVDPGALSRPLLRALVRGADRRGARAADGGRDPAPRDEGQRLDLTRRAPARGAAAGDAEPASR